MAEVERDRPRRKPGRPRKRGKPIRLTASEELTVRAFLVGRQHFFATAIERIEALVGDPVTDWPERTLDYYYGMLACVLFLLKTVKQPIAREPLEPKP